MLVPSKGVAYAKARGLKLSGVLMVKVMWMASAGHLRNPSCHSMATPILRNISPARNFASERWRPASPGSTQAITGLSITPFGLPQPVPAARTIAAMIAGFMCPARLVVQLDKMTGGKFGQSLKLVSAGVLCYCHTTKLLFSYSGGGCDGVSRATFETLDQQHDIIVGELHRLPEHRLQIFRIPVCLQDAAGGVAADALKHVGNFVHHDVGQQSGDAVGGSGGGHAVVKDADEIVAVRSGISKGSGLELGPGVFGKDHSDGSGGACGGSHEPLDHNTDFAKHGRGLEA